MGNELLSTQTLNGADTNLTTSAYLPAMTPIATNNNALSGSLFNLPTSGSDYSKDLMMPDYLKNVDYSIHQLKDKHFYHYSMYNNQSGSIFNQNGYTRQAQQTQQTQQAQYQPAQLSQSDPAQAGQQPQAAPSFGGSQEQLAQYYGQNPALQSQDAPKPTKIGKVLGVLAGIAAPLVPVIKKVAKEGVSISKAANLKTLAIKIPGFALAAWCAGSIIDAVLNSKKSQQTA